jgi:hypothetical protein
LFDALLDCFAGLLAKVGDRDATPCIDSAGVESFFPRARHAIQFASIDVAVSVPIEVTSDAAADLRWIKIWSSPTVAATPASTSVAAAITASVPSIATISAVASVTTTIAPISATKAATLCVNLVGGHK